MLIDEIKQLYRELPKKTKFKIYAAAKFNRQPTSIHNHWLANFWAIPLEHQEKMKDLLLKWDDKYSKL